MDQHAAAETVELLEAEREEAAAETEATPEPEAIPDPPETAVGIVHELGSIAAVCEQNTRAVADLETRISALREEMSAIARVEAEHLLDTILAEAASGEAQAEAAAPASGKAKWWEVGLSGRR